MRRSVFQIQRKSRATYQDILKLKEEIEMKLATRMTDINTWLTKGLSPRTPVKLLGGFLVGALLMTAAATGTVTAAPYVGSECAQETIFGEEWYDPISGEPVVELPCGQAHDDNVGLSITGEQRADSARGGMLAAPLPIEEAELLPEDDPYAYLTLAEFARFIGEQKTGSPAHSGAVVAPLEFVIEEPQDGGHGDLKVAARQGLVEPYLLFEEYEWGDLVDAPSNALLTGAPLELVVDAGQENGDFDTEPASVHSAATFTEDMPGSDDFYWPPILENRQSKAVAPTLGAAYAEQRLADSIEERFEMQRYLEDMFNQGSSLAAPLLEEIVIDPEDDPFGTITGYKDARMSGRFSTEEQPMEEMGEWGILGVGEWGIVSRPKGLVPAVNFGHEVGYEMVGGTNISRAPATSVIPTHDQLVEEFGEWGLFPQSKVVAPTADYEQLREDLGEFELISITADYEQLRDDLGEWRVKVGEITGK